jgi:hypothetical protein
MPDGPPSSIQHPRQWGAWNLCFFVGQMKPDGFLDHGLSFERDRHSSTNQAS